MSEFGYIMELLAKGKVSVSAVGLCPRSRLGTHDLRVGCDIGAVPCWGDTSWNPGLCYALAHPSCTQCTVAAFSLCRRKGTHGASWRSGAGARRERMGTKGLSVNTEVWNG